MLHISNLEDLKKFIQEKKGNGQTVGFVPTLGALHNGHMSLINRASNDCDIVVCSVFVNPTQFDDPNDLKKYPRTLEKDIEKLRKNKCDVCFTPSVAEVYPNGKDLKELYDLGNLEQILEGATRPGHYQGVCQVVERLLEMVEPTVLFLGQKDYQQVQVLSKMIRDKAIPVQVTMCDIIREKDGLALSSRNVRLSEDERVVANELYKTLKSCKDNAKKIPLDKLQIWAETNLNLNELIRTDYIKFCDGKTLEEISSIDGVDSIVVLGAIFLGPIRLIDNIIIR